MTRAEIDAVLARVKTWPIQRQQDAAQTLLDMERLGTSPYILSDAEECDLDEAELEIARGEVATDEEVAALLGRLRSA